MKKLVMALAALLLGASGAAADIVIFTSGSAKEGIIEAETPASVKMRVRGSVIGFSRSNIERIEYASEQENDKLHNKWLQEEKDREEERNRKREEKKEFEKQQLDKGLIKAGDKWVTKAERAELKRQGLRTRIRAQKNEQERDAREAALAAEEEAEEEEGEQTEQVGQNPLTKGVGKISLSAPSIKHPDVDSTVLDSRITNKGKLGAESIFVEIMVYDKQGTLILAETEEMPGLGAGSSRKLSVDLDVDPRDFGKAKARITGVVWETF